MRTALLFLALISFSACSSKLNPAVMVPEIPQQRLSDIQLSVVDAEVAVSSFFDERSVPVVATVNNQQTTLLGNVGNAVSDNVVQALQSRGFQVADGAPIVLSGAVRRWSADVQPGMSAKVNAEAEIRIEVRDPADKRIYGGTYTGTAFLQESSIGDKELQRALAVAMSEAVGQMASDRRLLDLLASF